MPKNKNAVIRYKLLDDALSDRHHNYSMNEITDRVNRQLESLGYLPVTKRCLEKDLEFLQGELFNAPVDHVRINGKACVKYKYSSYSLFTHELTKEEMSILYEVLNTVGQFEGLPNFDWLDSLRQQYSLNRHKRILSFSSNPRLKNVNMMAELYECISNNSVINRTYQRFQDTEPETYLLHPYLLKQYNNRWYVVGLRPDVNKIYTLPLDRIEKLETKKEEKYIKYDGDIEERFKNTIGITVYDDAEPKEIIFWISNDTAPYIITKPIHNSQTELKVEESTQYYNAYKLPTNGKIFKLHCTLNYELQQELIRNFHNIIVLEPIDLRKEIIEKVNQMQKNYENLAN